MPWYLSLIIVFIIAFGLANLLRFLHNKKYTHTENSIINYYKYSPDFDVNTIEDAIKILAKKRKNDYVGFNLEIPINILNILKEKFKSQKTIEELSYIYINSYFEKNQS